MAPMTRPATEEGSVGTVRTEHIDLPEPLALDCGRTLDGVRIAYETYGNSDAREGQRHPRLPRPLRRRARGGLQSRARGGKRPRRLRGRRARHREEVGPRLVGRNDRPGKGVRYRPLLRGGDEPDRRLPRLDGSVIGQPFDEEAVRPRFSHADRRGHGPRGARFPARARDREASHRFRRIARRDASARMGGALSGFGREHHPHRVDRRSRSSRGRMERHRQKRDHGGPGLAGRPLLRDGTGAEGGHGGRAHGGTRHLPFRLLHGARNSDGDSRDGRISPTR